MWSALLGVMGRAFSGLPNWLASAWGLEPRARSGHWQGTVEVGATLPGFTVTEFDPPRTLVLRGGHRFSRYELRFELEPLTTGGTDLRAGTWAEFPGLQGRLYRALVISSQGHRIAVGRILSRVASRAESEVSV